MIVTQYLQTVKNNEKLMTKKEIERAQAAVNLQEYLEWPSTTEFIDIISGNEICNVDFTVDDVKSEPTPCLKGKMTRRRTKS